MTYSQSPDPIVWFVHEDGTWSGFTYDRENNITAWHKHRSGDIYSSTPYSTGNQSHYLKSFCTIYSTATSSDTTIYLFDRQIQGYSAGPVLQLESIDGSVWQSCLTTSDPYGENSGYYLDSWITATPSNGYFPGNAYQTIIFYDVGSIAPCYAIPGIAVRIQGFVTDDQGVYHTDGYTFNDGTYNAGFPLQNQTQAAANIIGFKIVSTIAPNRLEIPMQTGTSQMSKWRIVRVSSRVYATSGSAKFVYYYGDAGKNGILSDYTELPVVAMNDFISTPFNYTPTFSFRAPYGSTGQTKPEHINMDFSDSVDFYIVSDFPRAYNLLALIMDIEIGGISGA